MTHHESHQAVSVVIPTHNRRPFIADILRPVLDDPATGEVIVVIDGSRDGTLELLNDLAEGEPRLRPIFQENAGDAAARQRGIEEATLDTVVLLDDDVFATPGMISGHARHHGDGARTLVLGYMPTQLPEPRRPGQAATYLYAQNYESKCDDFERDPTSIFDNFWMGNFSLPRQCALEVGLATRNSVRRHSDMEFGFRCRDAGIHAIFDRTLKARHVYGRGMQQFADQCRRSGDARAKLSLTRGEMREQLDPFILSTSGRTAMARVICSPAVHPLSAPLARAATAGAGRLHAWGLETRAAAALGRIECCYGFARTRRST